MFDISPVQIMIVLVIALLVFGPKRLPEMGRSVGRGIREFKGAILDDAPPARPASAPAPDTTATATPAVADTSDDDVLDGVVVPGDAPPRTP